MRTLLPLIGLTLAAAVSAQSPLDTFALTTFNASTSNGADNGVYFDLDFPNFPALITDIDKATTSGTAGAMPNGPPVVMAWACLAAASSALEGTQP